MYVGLLPELAQENWKGLARQGGWTSGQARVLNYSCPGDASSCL